MSQEPPPPPPKPTLTSIPIPLNHPHTIDIISNVLTPNECSTIIEAHRNLTPSNVTPGTVRTREVFEDGELAGRVWGRLRGFYEDGGEDDEGGKGLRMGKDVVTDEDGEVWRVKGLNEVWRLCFYAEGGKFSPHQDGNRLENINLKSFMTLNIYLNTVPPSHGGSTRFFSSQPTFPIPTNLSDSDSQIVVKTNPIEGTAAVFRDTIWHDGEALTGKESKKWLLRTDFMYERGVPFEIERVWGALGREEKGRKCLGIAEGLEEAERGGEAVGWYKRSFKLWPGLQHGK